MCPLTIDAHQAPKWAIPAGTSDAIAPCRCAAIQQTADREGLLTPNDVSGTCRHDIERFVFVHSCRRMWDIHGQGCHEEVLAMYAGLARRGVAALTAGTDRQRPLRTARRSPNIEAVGLNLVCALQLSTVYMDALFRPHPAWCRYHGAGVSALHHQCSFLRITLSSICGDGRPGRAVNHYDMHRVAADPQLTRMLSQWGRAAHRASAAPADFVRNWNVQFSPQGRARFRERHAALVRSSEGGIGEAGVDPDPPFIGGEPFLLTPYEEKTEEKEEKEVDAIVNSLSAEIVTV